MRKTIYISDEYDKVQELVAEKGRNFSKYVCDLILKDLIADKEEQSNLLINEIKELREMLMNGNISLDKVSAIEETEVEEDELSEERVEELTDNILGF